MCSNLLGVAHEFNYTRITFDLVDCAVEVGDLAIGGEDVHPEEIPYTALKEVQCSSMPLVCAVAKPLTVSTRPTRIMPKLKLCCVALAAFSPTESSVQGTYPLSLNGVTALRFDLEL